jgi:hypothetical protein
MRCTGAFWRPRNVMINKRTPSCEQHKTDVVILLIVFYAEALLISSSSAFYYSHALPARPTWIISPVSLSSLLKTGQLVPSALASVISSLVPKILNLLSSGLMDAYKGNSAL